MSKLLVDQAPQQAFKLLHYILRIGNDFLLTSVRSSWTTSMTGKQTKMFPLYLDASQIRYNFQTSLRSNKHKIQ